MTQQRLTADECRRKKYWCGECKEWKFDDPIVEKFDYIRMLSGWRGSLFRCRECGCCVGRKVDVVS